MKSLLAILLVATTTAVVSAYCKLGAYCPVDPKEYPALLKDVADVLGRDQTRKVLEAWEQVVDGANFALLTKGDERHYHGLTMDLYCLVHFYEPAGNGRIHLHKKECRLGGQEAEEHLRGDLEKIIGH